MVREDGAGHVERVEDLARARRLVAHGAVRVAQLTQRGALERRGGEDRRRDPGLTARRRNGQVVVVEEKVVKSLDVTQT